MNSLKRTLTIAAKDHRINEQIRAREVRLIGADRQHVGIVGIQDALRMAREAQLDLVEISPQAEPPVVQIMDFGKFLYEQHKKEREAKKAQKIIEVKEIQLRPKTDPHHRGFKVRDARKWLEEGMKVKVRIRFRGREIAYPHLAREDLDDVAKELADIAIIEQLPNMEGRTMLMVLAPAGKPKKSSGKKEQQGAQDQDTQSDE
jgi:translation initiation factor IF-3